MSKKAAPAHNVTLAHPTHTKMRTILLHPGRVGSLGGSISTLKFCFGMGGASRSRCAAALPGAGCTSISAQRVNPVRGGWSRKDILGQVRLALCSLV